MVIVALQIAYLPALYQAFNRRESLVAMLESRAGVPAWGPEILIRHQLVGIIDSLPDFPPRLKTLVLHMILSHHGKLEFGSPKLPMTPEAILLSALDDLEARFQAMRNEFAAAKASGKSADETTEWVRSMDRPLFNSRAFLANKN